MLLPLVPSVHPSALLAESLMDERQAACRAALERDRHTCRFCGLPAGSWRDVFHRNDDHHDWSPENLAASCPLCHAVQHVGDAEADLQMRVVWLPEVTQNLLNVVVRGIHHILHREGLPPTLEKRPIFNRDDVSAAWRAYVALDRRSASARTAVDTDTPRDLAAALRGLSSSDYTRRASLLGGLRLLHRGRAIHDGRDVYPEQLARWFPPTPAASTATAPSS